MSHNKAEFLQRSNEAYQRQCEKAFRDVDMFPTDLPKLVDAVRMMKQCRDNPNTVKTDDCIAAIETAAACLPENRKR